MFIYEKGAQNLGVFIIQPEDKGRPSEVLKIFTKSYGLSIQSPLLVNTSSLTPYTRTMSKVPGVALKDLLKILPAKEISALSYSLGEWFSYLLQVGIIYNDFNTGAVFCCKENEDWALTGVDLEGACRITTIVNGYHDFHMDYFSRYVLSNTFNADNSLFLGRELAATFGKEKMISWPDLGAFFKKHHDMLDVTERFMQ